MKKEVFQNPVRKSSGQDDTAFKDKAEAEERYRNLVDYAPDGIVILELDTGLFVDEVNPQIEKMFGVSRDKILGILGPIDFSPKYQPDGRLSSEASLAYITAAYAGDIQRFEWVHLNARGEEIPCQITLVPFPDPIRRLVRASIIDVTKQKKAEQTRLALENQLAHSQRLEMVGQMTGGVAHDFNNVLSALLGNLELLQQKVADSESVAIIKSAIEATEQGAGLTRAMLNYARQAPLIPETFKLSYVVQKMESLISRTIPARITLTTDLRDEQHSITADLSNTESAILNLVMNACDATPNHGHIKIRVVSISVAKETNSNVPMSGPYVVLSVQDTGEGIPADLIDKIDGPFFTTKGVGQHSGLGLSMVQGFVSQSGGFLKVNSTVGEGTTINLYFPATRHPIQNMKPASNTSTQIELSREKTGRILLVEDNDTVRELIGQMLSRQGYEVLTAFCTDSAIQVYEQVESIDLLITDIAIPGRMQGPQLAKFLKRFDKQLKVIFISGYSFGLETHEAGLVKSDILITKPFKRKLLLKIVDETMHSVRQHEND